MENFPRALCALLTYFLLLSRYALAESVQFCKFGARQSPQEAIDFCVGITAQQNHTSHSDDVYIALSVTRAQSHATGWTAVGIGSAMKGSLMFVVYGDPLDSASPVLSIRTADGYVFPETVPSSEISGVSFEVLESSWEAVDEAAVAKATLVCYGCTSWAGSAVSTSDSAQPWIWAWNTKQVFKDFSEDVKLESHSHEAGGGGTGAFYVDMIKAIKGPPSLPYIIQDVGSLGAFEKADSEEPYAAKSWKKFSRGKIHGLLMILAFTVMFPAGAMSIRSSISKPFKYHWMLQLSASIVVLVGVGIGLVMSNRISTTHQMVGIAMALCLGLQSFFGWRHHVIFVQLQRRSWFSSLHVYLGRVLIVVGWANILSGLSLAGFEKGALLGVAFFELVEAAAIWFWMWAARRKNSSGTGEVQTRWGEEQNNFFALEENDTDDEDEHR